MADPTPTALSSVTKAFRELAKATTGMTDEQLDERDKRIIAQAAKRARQTARNAFVARWAELLAIVVLSLFVVSLMAAVTILAWRAAL